MSSLDCELSTKVLVRVVCRMDGDMIEKKKEPRLHNVDLV